MTPEEEQAVVEASAKIIAFGQSITREKADDEWDALNRMAKDYHMEKARASLKASGYFGLVGERDRLSRLAAAALDTWGDGWCGEWDGGDLQDALEAAGLLERAIYDPEKHGEIDVEPGDTCLLFTEFAHECEARSALAKVKS